MKKRLSRATMEAVKLIMEGKPRGTEFNNDHGDCSAGEDNRSRLYYKVTDDGKMLLAHCFNCGCSGAVRINAPVAGVVDTESAAVERSTALSQYETDEKLWGRAEPVNKTVPIDEWPMKYFADSKNGWPEFALADCFGIRATGGWVVIPRGWGDDNVITGFDCRVRSDSHKEYTRNIHPDYKDLTKILIYNTSNSNIAIICEDPISAIKVCLAGYSGVALCGTHLSGDDAFKLGMLYDTIVMWLDNDKPEVIAKANDNANKLKLYNNKVYINYADTDPKKYTLDYIRSQVEGLTDNE